MQLQIRIYLNSPLSLPLAYHHIIQGIIYETLRDDSGINDYYHDEGYVWEKRRYKLFTFGLLEGKYCIYDKQIWFQEEVRLEIRSVDTIFIETLKKRIEENGLRFGETIYKDVELQIKKKKILKSEIIADMKSPICVYETDASKHTHYYRPGTMEFSKAVNSNFQRKYFAAFGQEPDGDIEIFPYRVRERDEYVTRYKGYYIFAWKGEYRICGKPDHLSFLYETGIGSKNSQGFGMFSEVEQ